MTSVTGSISKLKQPYGGYLPSKVFKKIYLDDGNILNAKENIRPQLIGIAVDYLTRFMQGVAAKDAFYISLTGAQILAKQTKKYYENKRAINLLSYIQGLDKKSIISACKLAGYDVCTRFGVKGYKPVQDINPDDATVQNIQILVKRNLAFFNQYGPIVKRGITFDGGYTNNIDTGDGDYLTKDTLWDLKILKNSPTSNQRLQILIYYLMGLHSIHMEFISIKKLGIYNPRKNLIYLVDIKSISKDVIQKLEIDFIGYPVSYFLNEKNINVKDLQNDGSLVDSTNNIYYWKNYLIKVTDKIEILSRNLKRDRKNFTTKLNKKTLQNIKKAQIKWDFVTELDEDLNLLQSWNTPFGSIPKSFFSILPSKEVFKIKHDNIPKNVIVVDIDKFMEFARENCIKYMKDNNTIDLFRKYEKGFILFSSRDKKWMYIDNIFRLAQPN